MRTDADRWGIASTESRPLCARLAAVVVASLLAACSLPAEAAAFWGQDRRLPPAQWEFWREFKAEVAALERSWIQRPYATGNWEGLRDRLTDWGTTLAMSYVADILGNPVGGRRRGLQYDDNIGIDVDCDLAKLAGLTGMRLHVSGSSRSGGNLSRADVGNVFLVSDNFGGETVRLYALYVEQSLYTERVNIRLGRIGTGDEFLTSPLYNTFVNSAFDGNPISVPLNVPAFSTYPVATWGLRATLKPDAGWYVMGGLYNGDPTLGRNGAHGTDFSLRYNAGVFTIGEVGYLHNQRADSTGLPGNYRFGGYYHSGKFQDLSRAGGGDLSASSGPPQRKVHGNYGLYVLIDQMAYREGGPESSQGLTPFVGFIFAPSSNSNIFPFFFMTGLVYQGLIPGRDRDVTALGLAYGEFSGALRRAGRDNHHIGGAGLGWRGFEMMLELTYEFALTPWLTVQPDAQYIIAPSGTSDIPDALVLGLQVSVNF